MSLKNKLTTLMNKLEKENPNANWKNLVTGVLLLLTVLAFSTWYFTNNTSTIENDTSLSSLSEYLEQDQQNEDVQEEQDVSISPEDSENEGTTTEVTNYTEDVVQPGEGLWHFAKRVCGDGEKYNYIADENNLNVHTAKLAPGQKLKVNCGTK